MAPNWFLALPVSPSSWLASLPPPPSGIRLFAPSDLHATIAFLGPVEPSAAEAAWDQLEWPLGPMRISLGEVVPLGPDDRYSALSALLVEGREDIEQAMAHVRGDAWRAAGARAETRAPKAHITLARPDFRANDAQRAVGLEWASSLDLRSIELTLGSVALFTRATDTKERNFTIVRERSLL